MKADIPISDCSSIRSSRMPL